MKKTILLLFTLILTVFFFANCTSKSVDNSNSEEGKNQAAFKGSDYKEHTHAKPADEEHAREQSIYKDLVHKGNSEEGIGEVYLSMSKFNSLGIKVDTIPTRTLSIVNDTFWPSFTL